METARKKNVILMGFKGCGKTTVGGPLADALGVPFVDTDRLIEKIYEEKEGPSLTCREIFQKRGETFFRDLEREALEKVCNLGEAVIALGGGAIEHPELLARLKQNGLLVYLQVSSEELFRRIESQGLPPFLSPEDPRRAFEELLQKRSSLYEEWADAEVSNGGGPVSEVVSKIAALVGGKYARK
ncbi:MAG: shikimate kinase [Candidatus Tectomicrobia bacterium]|uniref:Shikimate kinase n=1 Tax=Tectimicrobiota bacterium TaxID=2528274 RepID=A0A932GMP1_UNCTE|nr:shikimate kinase [Candidatus Tectomicrobia bacterium]